MHLYKNHYPKLFEIQQYISRLSTPSIILTNWRSSNSVGIDYNDTSYRDDDNEETKHRTLLDFTSYLSEVNKSIAVAYINKGFHDNIYTLIRQEKKIVLVNDLYALYLSNYIDEKVEVCFVAQLCKNNMEILKITYKKENKLIDCKVEIVDDFSETKLINRFKPTDESENDLENLKLWYSNEFNSALVKYITELEIYFIKKTDNFQHNIYFHLPNYIADIPLNTKLILDFSNDFSIGAIRFADFIYSKSKD